MHLSPIINELVTFPLFLRFDNVKIWCEYGDQLIEEKCKLIESQLLPLKPTLNDANMVDFFARISQNERNQFSDHLKLLDYIRNRFLPICNLSRGYNFQIWFPFYRYPNINVIASILGMDEIKHCSNVEIGIMTGIQKRLPIEEISNWLEPSADVKKNNLQNQKERFLKIFNGGVYGTIQNAREMIEHLAKVLLYFFYGRYNFLICSLPHNNNKYL